MRNARGVRERERKSESESESERERESIFVHLSVHFVKVFFTQ